MSATGAAIQVKRIRPPWALIASVVLALGIVGSLAVQVSERNVQPAPEAVAGQIVPTTALATESGAARTEIYRELGRLARLSVESPFQSETGLMKARMYEALGRLSAPATDRGRAPDVRGGSAATKTG
jgi:hypothetical protein